MQLVNGKLVMGKKNCKCSNGQQAGRITCPTCKGTGRGARGGARKCQGGCYGDGQKWSWEHPVTCTNCNGNYINFEDEDRCDYMPDEIWQGLEFKVYRHNRPLTGNESLLGIGCVFSCTDYGDAWKANDDAALIADVKSHTSHQATKVTKEDGTICSHVGIFVSPGGYSVRAVFEDVKQVEAQIARERPYREYMAVGTAIADAGGNGTLGALYRS